MLQYCVDIIRLIIYVDGEFKTVILIRWSRDTENSFSYLNPVDGKRKRKGGMKIFFR